MVTLTLFSTIALTIFILESAIPPLVPIPGVKLGLANIITLFVMVKYGDKEAFIVLFIRIILANIVSGQVISLIYSLFGGFLCLVSMCLINRLLHSKYLYITSVFGAVFHNIGQIIAAAIIIQSISIFAYLPVLLISGIITGLFTGFCTHFTISRLKGVI